MVKESSSVRKKRKTQSGDSDAEMDIYKKVCQFEEKEASNRNLSVDADIYFNTCKNIHDLLNEVRDLKHNQDGEIFENKMDYLSQIVVQICFIKKLNRIEKLNQVGGRETLNGEKQKCDSIKLNYQNLVYELHHLIAEIQKCLSFKSDDEGIELVPLEEFMKNAPDKITSKFKDHDKNNLDQEHALRLARLEWELTQRKNLAEECKALEERKKSIMSDIAERNEKLNQLLPLLDAVIQAAKPLQEHLGMPLDQTRKEHKLAKLLAGPLYILYANVVAYNSVYDTDITAVIKGSKDEALQWKEAQELTKTSLINEEDDSNVEELENEEVVEVKKRRHRKSTQQTDPMEEKKKKLLDLHPLTVELNIPCKDGPSLTITFSYYNKLKVVTVISKAEISNKITANTARDILCGENILSELFENDTGLESPNPSAVYQLQKVGIVPFQVLTKEIGLAYKWAQSVCGIDYLSTKISEKLSQQNVETVLKIIQERLGTRTQLAKQMQDLEQNQLPKIPENLLESEHSSVSALSKWNSITYQTYCQQKCTRSLVEDEIVSLSDMFYSAIITRGNASLKAFIAIKNSYPTPPPIISLCLDYNKESFHSENSDEIRDLERVINVELSDSALKSSWVLSLQLTRLCSYLDVYLESEDSKAFPQSSKFLKCVSGPNRRKPFKFRKIGTGIFTQY